jgi:hypothetical protein
MNVIGGMQDQTISPIQFEKLLPWSIHPVARAVHLPQKSPARKTRRAEENDNYRNRIG